MSFVGRGRWMRFGRLSSGFASVGARLGLSLVFAPVIRGVWSGPRPRLLASTLRGSALTRCVPSMITELDRRGVSFAGDHGAVGDKSYNVAVRYVRHRDEFLHDPLAPWSAAR